MRLRQLWILVPALCFGWVTAAGASDLETDPFARGSVELLRRYLQIDTVNPPGNEMRAVDFLAGILSAEGIPFEVVETAPGRGNIWARLEGGDEPALLLLHHTDVVPAEERFWDVDPLSGEIVEGYVYGRGALDAKGLGILHLQAFIALHRQARPLRRDVIFMATADEEAGGSLGAGWLVRHRPELFADVGYLLNEGGGGSSHDGRVAFSVEVTQKVPFWLRLVANGEPGHGSTPRPHAAVSRLVRALARLEEHEFEARVVPSVEAYFEGLARLERGERSRQYADLERAVDDPYFLRRLHAENPRLHALTRNTCSINRLEGSGKINVVPAEASAEIDCRLLPDQDPDLFLQELRRVLADPTIRIEPVMSFSPSVSSTKTELFRDLRDACRDFFPAAEVLPSVVAGFTDSHFFRDLGIVSYGFSPTVLGRQESGGVHGNNERVSILNVERGARLMLDVLERFVY